MVREQSPLVRSASVRFISPLDRILYLKSMPIMKFLPPEELAAVAEVIEERHFRPGEYIVPDDVPADAVHLLVEGRVQVYNNGKPARIIEAPGGIGFLALFAQTVGVGVAVALDECLTLTLDGEFLLELFEENFDFLYAGLQGITRDLLETRELLPSNYDQDDNDQDETPYPEEPLDLVQRLILMRTTGAFAECNLDSLRELATRFEEVRLPEGATLWQVGERSDFGVIIVWGEVECRSETRTWRAGTNFAVGYLDALAAQPRSYEVVTTTPLVGLKGSIEAFIDVLEDEFELAFELLSLNSRALLQAWAAVERARASELGREK